MAVVHCWNNSFRHLISLKDSANLHLLNLLQSTYLKRILLCASSSTTMSWTRWVNCGLFMSLVIRPLGFITVSFFSLEKWSSITSITILFRLSTCFCFFPPPRYYCHRRKVKRMTIFFSPVMKYVFVSDHRTKTDSKMSRPWVLRWFISVTPFWISQKEHETCV